MSISFLFFMTSSSKLVGFQLQKKKKIGRISRDRFKSKFSHNQYRHNTDKNHKGSSCDYLLKHKLSIISNAQEILRLGKSSSLIYKIKSWKSWVQTCHLIY